MEKGGAEGGGRHTPSNSGRNSGPGREQNLVGLLLLIRANCFIHYQLIRVNEMANCLLSPFPKKKHLGTYRNIRVLMTGRVAFSFLVPVVSPHLEFPEVITAEGE